MPIGQAFEPLKGWVAHFSGAGHILGAASILLEVGGRRILFSGDLGRQDDALMLAPEPPPAANAVVCESTYGDRVHPVEDVLGELGPALKRCAARGGTAVVPVFEVGRAQALLHAIAELKANHALPRNLPIYLDSPMAIHSTGLYARHLGAHRLNTAQVHAMDSEATMTRTADESKAIAVQHGPKVILSASGMATGRRVLHHLDKYLPDYRNMVVLTGYLGARHLRRLSGRRCRSAAHPWARNRRARRADATHLGLRPRRQQPAHGLAGQPACGATPRVRHPWRPRGLGPAAVSHRTQAALARAGAGAWQHVEHVEHVEHLNAPLRRCAFSPGGGSHQWPGEAGSTVFFGWVTRSRQRAETFFH